MPQDEALADPLRHCVTLPVPDIAADRDSLGEAEAEREEPEDRVTETLPELQGEAEREYVPQDEALVEPLEQCVTLPVPDAAADRDSLGEAEPEREAPEERVTEMLPELQGETEREIVPRGEAVIVPLRHCVTLPVSEASADPDALVDGEPDCERPEERDDEGLPEMQEDALRVVEPRGDALPVPLRHCVTLPLSDAAADLEALGDPLMLSAILVDPLAVFVEV